MNDKGNEITKELLDLLLNDYYRYPEVFPVNRNYCTFVYNFISINLTEHTCRIFYIMLFFILAKFLLLESIIYRR